MKLVKETGFTIDDRWRYWTYRLRDYQNDGTVVIMSGEGTSDTYIIYLYNDPGGTKFLSARSFRRAMNLLINHSKKIHAKDIQVHQG
jgi:hypothetical protein